MVKKIKEQGVKVMAYYVADYDSDRSKRNFKTMYGDDSRFININDIIPITKTLNELFLTK
jgi:hypothetical protein